MGGWHRVKETLRAEDAAETDTSLAGKAPVCGA